MKGSSSSYERWKHALLDPKFQLIGILYRQRSNSEAEKLANLVFNFFKAHKKVDDLINWVIIEEVKTAAG